MNTEKTLSEKILIGIKKAVDKMIAAKAKADEDIVLVDDSGKPYRIKAKEFLSKNH